MLLHFNKTNLFDNETNSFVDLEECDVELEHSLASIFLWEGKWKKPFLSKDEKSVEESMDYILCMAEAANPSFDPNIRYAITSEHMHKVNSYIEDPHTATVINDKRNGPTSREIMTAELLYFSMVHYKIPFECQHWHLNRLIMLVRICDIKNSPPNKMSKTATANSNRMLNKARRQAMGTSG